MHSFGRLSSLCGFLVSLLPAKINPKIIHPEPIDLRTIFIIKLKQLCMYIFDMPYSKHEQHIKKVGVAIIKPRQRYII